MVCFSAVSLAAAQAGIRPMRCACSAFWNRADQPACKPGSVGPGGSRLPTWQPFLWDGRCRPPRATNPGDWPGERACPPRGGRAAPIRFCSRWGLPCRPRCRVRGALLPHPFTLTPDGSGAVCSLWHCPWGRPRRTLSGTVSPWSPDFPPRANPERLPGRLIRGRHGPSPPLRSRARGAHQVPVFSMEVHGSCGSLASPFCRISMEMPSGDFTKAMRPSRGGRLMVTPASFSFVQKA